MKCIIDDVHIDYDERVEEAQMLQLFAEERIEWLAKGKTLGRIDMRIVGDEIEVMAREKSPVRRTRRITGYLSDIDKFNDAKQAELNDRRPQL